MVKLPATLSPLHHRGAQHIKVEIPNEEEAKNLIRQVPGRKWSKTHGCWYVPYTLEAYRQLKKLFEVKVPDDFLKMAKPDEAPSETIGTKPGIVGTIWEMIPSQPVGNHATSEVLPPVIRIEKENDWRLKVYIPREQKEWIEKIKTIPGRAWNEKELYWSLPLTRKVLDWLLDWSNGRVQLPPNLPEGLPDDYVPKNWRQARPAPAAKPTAPPPAALQYPPEFRKILPEQTLGQAAVTPATPAAALINPGKQTSGTTKNVMTDIRSEKDKNLIPSDINKTAPYFKTIEKDGIKTKAVVGELLIVEKHDENVICAYVPHDKQDWIDFIKKIPGRQWNSEQKCWMLPLTRETMDDLGGYFREKLRLNFSVTPNIPDKWKPMGKYAQKGPEHKLNPMQQLAVTALEEKLILESKRFRTIKTYKNALAGLLAFYPLVKPSQISLKQINDYIVYKRRQHNYTNSTVNTLINALNAFYGRTLNQMEKVLALERPPKEKKLPNVLTKEEVERLLNAVENDKHKCMLVLIYSAGLRKGEVLRLRVRDLNASQLCLFVKNGKGGKDRHTFYPPEAQQLVSAYISKYKPRYWLFEGQTSGQYSETSLQIIFDKARVKSGVNPDITIHGLRHSFATHLTYDGVPLHEVKRLLGHENIATTEIYLHLANRFLTKIKSPLEGMKL
ncbi:MAG: tyrosine-type recombinase/integrase [Saprospiraceae bacterium]|nr:tyrosine-type recombinase/integrase [Saprospiraceae bacterium]